jgi:hypothetical protein
MKSTDFLKDLSEMTKIAADKLKDIINSTEEVEVEFTKPHIFTEDELDTLKTNVWKEASNTTLEAKIREYRKILTEKYGNEVDFINKPKTMENLIEQAIKIGEKSSAKAPTEQLLEKEKQIKALQESVHTLEMEKSQVVDEKNNILMEYQINSTISQALPKDYESTWTAEELSTLFRKNYEIIKEDNKMVVKKDGEIVRDKKTQEPIPVDAVFNSWLETKGAKKQSQGRGGDDTKPQKTSGLSGLNNMDDVLKYADENNLSPQQRLEVLQKVMKENKDFKQE